MCNCLRWGLGQVWRQLLHTDWVCQLQYISELNSILSCSLDKRLCLADVEARVTVKYLEGHTQGVRAVDWSKAYSFIASGGLDRNVMLWNPFQLQSMATLQVNRTASCSCRPVLLAHAGVRSGACLALSPTPDIMQQQNLPWIVLQHGSSVLQSEIDVRPQHGMVRCLYMAVMFATAIAASLYSRKPEELSQSRSSTLATAAVSIF